MATAPQIAGWIQSSFDAKELHYERRDDDTLRIEFPLECKLQRVRVAIRCHEDCYVVNSYIPLDADENCREKVAEYITRANYGLRFGNFEMDFNDGEVRFRMSLDCEDREDLSESMVIQSVGLGIRMFERYGDGLVAVMYGFKTPADAIAEAEA